jgi:hypothetical protein
MAVINNAISVVRFLKLQTQFADPAVFQNVRVVMSSNDLGKYTRVFQTLEI